MRYSVLFDRRGMFGMAALAAGLLGSGAAAADQIKLVAPTFPPLNFKENGAPAGIAHEVVAEASRPAFDAALAAMKPDGRFQRILDTYAR